MTVRVTRSGPKVVVRVSPRRVVSASVDTDSTLIVSYDDGQTIDTGIVLPGGLPSPSYTTNFRNRANNVYLGAFML